MRWSRRPFRNDSIEVAAVVVSMPIDARWVAMAVYWSIWPSV